jgi:hypothetical protein
MPGGINMKIPLIIIGALFVVFISLAHGQNVSQMLPIPVPQTQGGTGAISLGAGAVTPTGGSAGALADYLSGNATLPSTAATTVLVNPGATQYTFSRDNSTGYLKVNGSQTGNFSGYEFFINNGTLAAIIDYTGLKVPVLTASGQTSAVCYNISTGLITYNSGVTTCLVSTERLKDIQREIAPAEGLRIALAAKPQDYVNKQDPQGDEVGLVCEQMEKIDKRLVDHDKQGRCSGVRYEQYAGGILTAAVQQLKHDNDDLRQQIADLRRAVLETPKRHRT